MTQEAKLIQEVDKPGSEISTYIENLDGVLNLHLKEVTTLQNRLHSFKAKLKEENRLSKICLQQNEETGFEAEMEYLDDNDDDFPDVPRQQAPRVPNSYDEPPLRGSNKINK